MNTDTGNTLYFTSTIRGAAATLILDDSTARVEIAGEPSSAALFVRVADPNEWVTLTNEYDERLGALALVRVGSAGEVARIGLSAAAALSKRFGIDVYNEGEVVDFADVTWGAIRRGASRRRQAA